MPSRFTITEKWSDKWFRRLSPEGKLLFNYLCDKCDIAGFWEIDYELASFETGIPQRQEGQFNQVQPDKDIEGVFKELAKSYITDKKHLWLKNFLYHQGNLGYNPKSPIGKGIEKKLKSHNSLSDKALEYLEKQAKDKGIERVSKGFPNPTSKGNSNSNGKGKGSNERGSGGKQLSDLEKFTEKVIKKWKKKIGKITMAECDRVAMEISRLIDVVNENRVSEEEVLEAIDNYSKAKRLKKSLAGNFKLAKFIQRLGTERGKCYLSAYFQLENFGDEDKMKKAFENIRKDKNEKEVTK